jgi:hypothetical protein
MKIDYYTKAILTIIAFCLVWICMRDFATPVSAQRGAIQRVIIAGIENQTTLPVAIAKIEVADPTSLLFGTTTKSLPITITKVALAGPSYIDSPLAIPVSIRDIDLPVSLSGQGKTMPVTIKGVNKDGVLAIGEQRDALRVYGQVGIDNTRR